MGLFSRLRKSRQSANTNLSRSVLMPSVMTLISDGSVDDSELAQLPNRCSFSPIFAGQSGDVAMAQIKELTTELVKGDV